MEHLPREKGGGTGGRERERGRMRVQQPSPQRGWERKEMKEGNGQQIILIYFRKEHQRTTMVSFPRKQKVCECSASPQQDSMMKLTLLRWSIGKFRLLFWCLQLKEAHMIVLGKVFFARCFGELCGPSRNAVYTVRLHGFGIGKLHNLTNNTMQKNHFHLPIFAHTETKCFPHLNVNIFLFAPAI